MTDLREKLAEEIEAAMDNVHDMDVTFRQYAEAASAAIIVALPGLVKPLEWERRQANDGLVNYRIHIGYGLMNGVFALTCNGSTIGEFGTEDAAKVAAQADYTRRILAAFGIAEESE